MEQYFTVLASTYEEVALDFDWYTQIRLELIKPMLRETRRVVDVGTGNGETLIQLSHFIETGMGIDTDSEALRAASNRARALGIQNLRFEHADALHMRLPGGSCDLLLILGDVLSYSGLFGRTEEVLREARRVLRPKGTVVIDGMNWSWEYAQNPNWSFFLQECGGGYAFHSARRALDGVETIEKRSVIAATPLHDWLSTLSWPASRQGHRTSVDVRLHVPLPQAWLGYAVSERCRYFTARSITQQLESSGFESPAAVYYGVAYDIMSRAGLTDVVRQHVPLLARAEAQLARETSAGAGPWFFAWAGTPT